MVPSLQVRKSHQTCMAFEGWRTCMSIDKYFLTCIAINQTDWNRNCISVAPAVNSSFSTTQMTSNHHKKVKFRFKNERIHHYTCSVLINKVIWILLMLLASCCIRLLSDASDERRLFYILLYLIWSSNHQVGREVRSKLTWQKPNLKLTHMGFHPRNLDLLSSWPSNRVADFCNCLTGRTHNTCCMCKSRASSTAVCPGMGTKQ
jgi:hypothetical protein